MSFGWFQQDQSADRSTQDTCRGLDLCRPCQPITASEQLHDLAKGPTSSWSVVVSDQYHVTDSSLGSPRTLVANASKRHPRASAGRTSGGASVADYCSLSHAKHDRFGLEMQSSFGQRGSAPESGPSPPVCRFPRRSVDDRSLELPLRTTRCAIRQAMPDIGLTLPSKRFSLIAPDVPSTPRTRGHVP
ncbi:hypothetical protein Tsp_04502 [Trichinella spiralis]|uniref:hypothetical protein n=1 Tax=Trichinella spiralis TaxID=6334 RepID=UPI0001EFEEC4|nr:hypothetical protein Tsp_04502 [Trichinella spiralis]